MNNHLFEIKILDLFTKTKRIFLDNIIRYKYCISLVLLNFLTNYLFILNFKFVSDDWPMLVYLKYFGDYSTIELLSKTTRPIMWIITRIVSNQFGGYALGYHILNFITSTIVLLLIFSIAKYLFGKNNPNENEKSYAFIASLIFVILFNKDEMYAWGLDIINNMANIFYLGSIYYFISSEKKTYKLVLSLFFFLIAIFTYETAIVLPIFYFVYNWINKHDLKKPLYFIIPLGLLGIARLTNWFGYELTAEPFSREITSPQDFVPTFLRMILHSLGEAINNIIYSFYGLTSLNQVVFLGLVIMDILIIWLIFKYLLIDFKWNNFDGKYQNTINLVVISIAGLLLSYIPAALAGYIATRHVLYIDFFISLLLAILIGFIAKKRIFIFLMYFLIILCLLVNQGLYINWITSGEIQESVHQSIFDNSNKTTQYGCIYINATDLSRAKPNYAKYALSEKDAITRSQERDRIYSSFMHSQGLEMNAVGSMFDAANINLSKTTLIYGISGSDNIFISSSNTTLTYKNGYSGEYHKINRVECFEFNASNLLTYYKTYENTSFLFHR